MRNIFGKKRTNNWKEGFFPVIIERGNKYFEEGRILRHWQKEGLIYATVDGTQEYEVRIDPLTVECGCTCPYAMGGTPCKHMAAVWIALDEGAIVWEKPAKVEVPPIERKFYELPWQNAVDALPEELLRKEMMRLADQNENLQERLVLLNAGHLPEGLAEEWRVFLLEIADDYADGYGYIGRDLGENFFTELCEFMESKLPLLMKLHAPKDAFEVVRMAGSAAKRRPLYEADQDAQILFADQCLLTIEEIGADAPELKAEMEQWYRDFFGIQPGEYFFPAYEIKFIDNEIRSIPYYRLAGQEDAWKEAPFYHNIHFYEQKDARLYYDPIEDHIDFKRIEKRVQRKAKAELGDLANRLGSRHALWHHMKRIFKEDYGFDWHSGAEMNPGCDFD